MATLATYISFPGTAADAFAFYHEVFGGTLDLMRYSDFPPMEGIPFTPDPNAVAHAVLTLESGTIAGGDNAPGEKAPLKDTAYSLLIDADSVAEAEALIENLSRVVVKSPCHLN
ncbi:hypothetical protein CMUST_09255 [Corynebacterium mustelae]|uniref:PhnB-like domain-containing protein n=1 Tax=Corynebacterium mustelae TaxID=571915 RepID=A0A0G3H507_9CORY|nr:VOC family protein [Corynebacterium mustelae]AKK06167.1 hypothetical protein CMUST_09255 [Corynebacterium mustelae]